MSRSLDDFYGCWRRLRTDGVSDLFSGLGFTQVDVTRLMLTQMITPTGSTFDPAGVLYPSIALTELGSINRSQSCILDADPIATVYGGRSVQESAKFNRSLNSLVWRWKFLHNGVYYTLRIARTVIVDVKGQRIMTCAYESTNEITKKTEAATSSYLFLDAQPSPRMPAYFPLWTFGDDETLTTDERPLAFSLSPALVGRAVAEATASAAISKEAPPKIYIQQVLQCERLDLKVAPLQDAPSSSSSSSSPLAFSSEVLDSDCDPAPWSLVADGVHLDPRKAQLRSLHSSAIRQAASEGHNMTYWPNRLEQAAPPGSVAPGRLLLHRAHPFRFKYIPISSLQQGIDTPSEVAFTVLRDFVVLQGDGSTVSNKGGGWQYARDFAAAPEDWVAEPAMLKWSPGEPIVRRRVWMRLIVPQSEFLRADAALQRSFRDFPKRQRGVVKTGTLELFITSALSSRWVPCRVTIDNDNLLLLPERMPSVTVALTGATLRKLQQDTSSYRPKVPNDTRVEIELRPRDLAAFESLSASASRRKTPSYLLRCSHNEERSEWLSALGHHIVLLGSAGVGCYDECPLLHPAPLMFGELFMQVEVTYDDETKIDAANDAKAKAEDKSSSTSTSTSSRSSYLTWQLHRFFLFDEFLEAHHCNEDNSGQGHAPWKISLSDFSYLETSQDPLVIVLDSSDRKLTLRATSIESKQEWREALRRVLRARSSNALKSEFYDDAPMETLSPGKAKEFRTFSYSEDLVLNVRNNHVEESATVEKGAKPSVTQAKKLAQMAENLATGKRDDDVTLLSDEQSQINRRRKELEAAKISSQFKRVAVAMGLASEPSRPTPLIVSAEVTMAMNKIGLRTNKLFEGVWMLKRNKGSFIFRRRFVWLDADCHAFVWAKTANRQLGKPLILLPTVEAELNSRDGMLSWAIRGGGFNLELRIVEQVVKELESEIFSPQLWVDAVKALKMKEFR